MVTKNRIKDNMTMMKKLLIFSVVMFVFGYAMVPFYEKFCEVAGINNLLQPDKLVDNMEVDTERWVTIEFDANTRGLPWDFKPMERSVRIHPGEPVEVMYEITNNSEREINGQAIPSYSPRFLDKHLRKFECFCFTKQVLKPKEVRQMPVQFVIEPTLPKEFHTVTISYTFFELPVGTPAISEK
ncbi:cytochrome c oxidase assembly protein [Nitrosomonas sp.]|uniref:cytochrome c oxidase assembly protein n=1 Tax=Nitrosomonas sp. TaxID=42353 RepID=UPI001D29E56C|nr:cytochrome c oxidase assembly protein [Nitrosomonas sp.]MCB1948895.1 cytochrome c oxidase assembly protein [Nitrosomonas sp.]MDR4513751.1 cytochrome c oxidase assembly protein [Nitrosomonas sp.]